MNPGLQIRVRQRLPITVASLCGVLETDTLAQAEPVLRECLAQMPAALVIEGGELEIAASAHMWLLGLADSAAHWPGIPLVVTGDHPGLPTNGTIRSHSTLDSALAAVSATPFPQRMQLALPAEPSSCARARALVARACDDWGMRRGRRLAELLVSELVSNGVIHAGTRMKVTVRKRNGDLELSVRDHSAGRLPTEADRRDPRGFGLQLLAALSDTWGWSPAGRGKVVWTRLRGVV